MKSNIGSTVIETESFIKQAAALWSVAELDDLKDYLARNPLAGDEMPGTGGMRKLRWSRAGMGERESSITTITKRRHSTCSWLMPRPRRKTHRPLP
jgi:hypothetical protein